MSDHARAAMFDNIEQNLIEVMADFLDIEELQLDEAIALIKDPVKKEESELHIRMAKAAFEEKKKIMTHIPTYKEQFDKVTEAYINGTLEPYRSCACFIGNMLGGSDWDGFRKKDYYGVVGDQNTEHGWTEEKGVRFLTSVVGDF